jgi:hypothetical protein
MCACKFKPRLGWHFHTELHGTFDRTAMSWMAPAAVCHVMSRVFDMCSRCGPACTNMTRGQTNSNLMLYSVISMPERLPRPGSNRLLTTCLQQTVKVAAQ